MDSSYPTRTGVTQNLLVLETGWDQERKKRDERKMGKVREWKIKSYDCEGFVMEVILMRI